MPSLHDGFDDLVQKAFRAQVVIVSPSLLMLAIQVVQQIQKDARMREAADQIRDEVGRLVEGCRLAWASACASCRPISISRTRISGKSIISIEKIEAHGERIQQVEFGARGTGQVRTSFPRRCCASWKRASSLTLLPQGLASLEPD